MVLPPGVYDGINPAVISSINARILNNNPESTKRI